MMKQYGHISAMQPPALTADSGHRYHATGAAIIACENPCRNTAENLRMCDSCTITQCRHARRNTLWEIMSCTIFFVQDGFSPILFTFNPYSHANARF